MSKYDDLFAALDTVNTQLIEENPVFTGPGHALREVFRRTQALLDKQAGAEHFEEFWKLYPRKVGKTAAATAWIRMEGDKNFDAIKSNIAARMASKQWEKTPERIQYIPHATTYLNQRRWLDEGIPATKSGYRDV